VLRIWRSQRCEDPLLIVGRAEMTGKPPFNQSSPRKRSLLSAAGRVELLTTTPASLRRQQQLASNTTPGSSCSRLRATTPSIAAYFTPKNGSGPVLGPTATPVSQAKRGLKRRLTDSLQPEGDENVADSNPTKREKVMNTESTSALSSSIQALLRPGPAFTSPVKCPPAPPRLIASPLRRPLPAASPLRLGRQPLEALPSPTANLPNMVRDGPGVLPLNRCSSSARSRKERQVDWLTSYCKQRKKEGPVHAAAKSARSKNKPAQKGKIHNR
jgi:hypothetical protein